VAQKEAQREMTKSMRKVEREAKEMYAILRTINCRDTCSFRAKVRVNWRVDRGAERSAADQRRGGWAGVYKMINIDTLYA